MSDLDATIVTAYGWLDRAALMHAQTSYDTAALLSAVAELDRIVGRARGQDGLRDTLLRLHGKGTSVSTNQESLPELALRAYESKLAVSRRDLA